MNILLLIHSINFILKQKFIYINPYKNNKIYQIYLFYIIIYYIIFYLGKIN
jgi:hypothetical protein